MYTFSRHEFKYILSRHHADIIRHYVEQVGVKSDALQSGEYTVTSMYFDTPTLDDYYDKLGGFKYRKKLRIRIYGDDFSGGKNKVYTEIKRKHDMCIKKERAAVMMDAHDVLGRTAMTLKTGREHDAVNQFRYLFLTQGYRPHIVVRYKRRAYEERFLSKIRVTFDRNIEACKAEDFVRYSAMTPVTDEVIMEVKFDKVMPWWFGDMIHRFGIKREPYSKYSESVDALNKFNPMPR